MFVMKTGICRRPPLQWPQEVLAAGVCFPYILTLQPQMLSVYSMLDQQCKQTVSLIGAKGLLSTSGKTGDITSSPVAARMLSGNLPDSRFCSRVCLDLHKFSQSFLHPLFLKTKHKCALRWRVSVHRERHFQPEPGATRRADPDARGAREG